MSDKPKTASEKSADQRVMIVGVKYPDEFEKIVNEILSEGNWRIAQTEMSVTDHHYYAMLIKCKADDGHAEGRREALEMAQGLVDAVERLCKSMHPHPKEHPSMFAAKNAGLEALAKFEEWKDGK